MGISSDKSMVQVGAARSFNLMCKTMFSEEEERLLAHANPSRSNTGYKNCIDSNELIHCMVGIIGRTM
jgi:hypothetical protein